MSIARIDAPKTRRGSEARTVVLCYCCGDELGDGKDGRFYGRGAHRPLGPKGPVYCDDCVEHAVMVAGEVPP